jgi:hypothetical protein
MLVELEKSFGLSSGLPIDARHSLADIVYFAVGDKYLIRRQFGRVIELKRLDTLLDCIRSEFQGAECWDLDVSKSRAGDMLFACPRNVMGRAWNRDINKLYKKPEAYVTHYNLTGQWPENMELK